MNGKRSRAGFSLLLLSILCLMAALTKIWPSDRYQEIAVLSYIPSPILLASGGLLFLFQKTRRKLGRVLCLALIAISILFIAKENKHFFRSASETSGAPAPKIRILHWNVWQGTMGPEKIAREMANENPDVICLNEPRLDVTFQMPPYAKLLGSSWHEASHANLLILSKFPIQKLEGFGWMGMQGLRVIIQAKKPLNLLLVDVRSSPLLFRRTIFEALSQNLKSWDPPPDVVTGDFNTPEGSFSLKAIEKEYAESYNVVGNGLAYTWIAWIPFMKIDFIFARNPASIVKYHDGYTILSDHRWQWMDYQLR
jgi:endonuclease/exonuclease/phosphatase (EEP) superfamily protein YafD